MCKLDGAREIYLNRLTNSQKVLLLVYAKAQFDKLKTEQLQKLNERFGRLAEAAPLAGSCQTKKYPAPFTCHSRSRRLSATHVMIGRRA